MAISFDFQEEQIERSTSQLSEGRRAKELLVRLFPTIESRSQSSDDGYVFVIEIKRYQKVWGQAAVESLAWIRALDCLKQEGILSAFPEVECQSPD